MTGSVKSVYELAEYTVEYQKGGWYFGRSTRFDDKEQMRGPYSSVASVTLVIARQLKREITKRHAPPAVEP
jgi:hypothetical protein